MKENLILFKIQFSPLNNLQKMYGCGGGGYSHFLDQIYKNVLTFFFHNCEIGECEYGKNLSSIYKKCTGRGQAKKGIKNVFSIRVRNFFYSIPVTK